MPASPCRTGTGGRGPPPRSPKRSPPGVSTAGPPRGRPPPAGLPFVEYQIRQLTAIGIDEVVLAVGRHLVSVWEAYAATSPDGVHVRLAIEDEPLATAGPARARRDP